MFRSAFFPLLFPLCDGWIYSLLGKKAQRKLTLVMPGLEKVQKQLKDAVDAKDTLNCSNRVTRRLSLLGPLGHPGPGS